MVGRLFLRIERYAMDITITSVATTANETMWRAATNGLEVIGKTAGEALDGIRTKLGIEQNDLFVVYEKWQPDEYFTATQQKQLSDLMVRWRVARDAGKTLPAEDQKRLEELVEAELAASGKRAEKMALEMKK